MYHLLTAGKCNYTTALAEPSRLVAWSPDGETYVYSTRQALVVQALRSGKGKRQQPMPCRLAFVLFRQRVLRYLLSFGRCHRAHA